MVYEIKDFLYRIRSYSGIPHYVECETQDELFRYIATKYVLKGYPVLSVNRMDSDGSTPKIKVLTDKRFKEILKEERDK